MQTYMTFFLSLSVFCVFVYAVKVNIELLRLNNDTSHGSLKMLSTAKLVMRHMRRVHFYGITETKRSRDLRQKTDFYMKA